MTIIKRRVEGDIACLEWERGKANAFDIEFCRAIVESFAAEEESASRAVVLSGSGRMFSAGVDLKRLVDAGPSYGADFIQALDDAFAKLYFFDKPLVVAAHGHAIAGGCVALLCGDHRLMARGSGRIGAPELRVGVPFPTLVLEILRGAVAPRHLARVSLFGENVDIETAKEMGLVDEIVPQEELMPSAIARARNLAEVDPVLFRHSKRQLRQPARDFLTQHARRLDPDVHALWRDERTIAAVRAFIERTMSKG